MSKVVKKTTYSFLVPTSSKSLILLNGFLLVLYFLVISLWFEPSNKWLFATLMIGQAFYLWQCLSHLYTVWDMHYMPASNKKFLPPVDIYITVAGEPKEIVEETLAAAVAIEYPDFKVFVLNDGRVAKKDNWEEIDELAKSYGATPITRTRPGGAKAGNINNALQQTTSPFIVILDADHVPKKTFLQKTIPYMDDEKVAFVQSPQFYKNHKENSVTAGAWDQQQLFFGAICMGKNRLNSVTMAGTNMVIRRAALEQVGGMCADNVAEDFITGMFIHEKGWKSVYVPEVLAEGLAPEDFLSYYKQQLRWTKGSLEVFINFNPLFRKGLSVPQRLQYLASSGYYLSGVVVFLNALLPLIFFFTGAVPFVTSTMVLAVAFLPYIVLTLFNLQAASNYTYTFKSLAFSMSSWWIHLVAFIEVLIGKKSSFAITSKVKVQGNFIVLVFPHLFYALLTFCGITYSYLHHGLTPSLTTNATWGLCYIIIFLPFIFAALPRMGLEKAESTDVEKKVVSFSNV